MFKQFYGMSANPFEKGIKEKDSYISKDLIEAFYNTVRIHSHCGYLSPNQYEDAYKRVLDELCNKAS